MSFAVFDNKNSIEHITGSNHPESVERYNALKSSLKSIAELTWINGNLAKIENIELVHSKEYISLVKMDISSKKNLLSTGDTSICAGSWNAALGAAGAGIQAVKWVLKQEGRAFVLCRPPGHHAESSRGMGFCIFNNAAILAAYAIKNFGLSRVLIVDWDVHHGNGTQEIFYDNEKVFYFSTHQHLLYPGTGHANETGIGRGVNTTMNCPLPAGSKAAIIKSFTEKLIPAMDLYKPELIIISCGFDSHHLDPLGEFKLDEFDFKTLTEIVLKISKKYSKGRCISILEGGYNLKALVGSVNSHVLALK